MRNQSRLALACVCALLLTSCQGTNSDPSAPPADFVRDETADQAPAVGPIPAVAVDPLNLKRMPKVTRDRRDEPSRIEGPIDEATIRHLQEEARRSPPNPWVATLMGPRSRAPVPLPGFDHMDFVTSGQNFVPPDPELAVGPNHLVSVVNDAMYITDLTGTVLAPPISLPAFFGGTTGCTNLFDPNVLYDEQLDRFVVGIDANATGYCVAMSQTPDPTLPWFAYSFATVPPGPPATQDFFDYPHAGVGELAVYMGANIFNAAGTTFLRAEVWAMDKIAMSAGAPLPMPVMQTVANGFTPQPMNAHGFWQGTWPVGQPHHIVANQYLPGYSGDLIDVWSWTDPFGANTFTNAGFVDLAVATSVPGLYPIDAQQNAPSSIQANDYRVLDNEYRNGRLWISQTISCNPGLGLVDCVRWAELDPTLPAVVQGGVIGTDGEYRIFPDLAVNHCDDMTIGYTKTSSMTFPDVWASGRLGTDPPGSVAPEAPLLPVPAGVPYLDWSGPPHRWGDYTGATSGPDGVSTWYLGEYSKTIAGSPAANWGTWVNEFSSTCEADLQTTITDGVTQAVPGTSVTYTITVTNAGRGDSLGAQISDSFPAALTGVTWTCSGQAGPPVATCGTASGSGDVNITADLEAGSAVTLSATGTIDPAATGSLVNTVSAVNQGIQDLTPGNATAADTDVLTPTADLAMTVTNGTHYVTAGSTVPYTVVGSNAGASTDPAASIIDSVSGGLSVTSWTCAASGAASCGAPSGVGSLSDTPSLPPGGTVTYTVSVAVSAGASGMVSYGAGVSAGAGVTDPATSDNSASDTDPVGTDIFSDGFEGGNLNGWSSHTP